MTAMSLPLHNHLQSCSPFGHNLPYNVSLFPIPRVAAWFMFSVHSHTHIITLPPPHFPSRFHQLKHTRSHVLYKRISVHSRPTIASTYFPTPVRGDFRTDANHPRKLLRLFHTVFSCLLKDEIKPKIVLTNLQIVEENV